MAIKQSYGIKTPMLSTSLDTEITIQKDGIGLRPLPIKFVLITIVSGIACMKAVTSEIVSVGNVFQKGLFVILWLAITVLLFKSDKSKRLNFQNLISLLSYMFISTNRKVITRRTAPATDMVDICNIKGIDKTGLINFSDKNVGYMYRIIGSASALLFDDDKNRIVNAVDNFYRKIDDKSEFIFITLKESQKVYNQAAAVKRRYTNLKLQDSDLQELCNNQLTMLRDVVGKRYQSIHQYMIIKADGLETLTASKILLQNELDSSGLVFKRCIPLYQDEILDSLATVFTTPKYDDDISLLIRKNKGGVKENEFVKKEA